MVETSIITLLGVWFLLTLWKSVAPPKWRTFLDAVDVWHLVPRWTLFNHAPRDFRLWVRDREANGTLGDWWHVTLSYPRPWWLVLLWNPSCRRPATLFSLLRYQVVLAYAASQPISRAVPTLKTAPALWAPDSIPSSLLRNYLQNLPAEDGYVERQYAILEGPGSMDDAGSRKRYIAPFFPLKKKADEG
jgi:hypothetical protein